MLNIRLCSHMINDDEKYMKLSKFTFKGYVEKKKEGYDFQNGVAAKEEWNTYDYDKAW